MSRPVLTATVRLGSRRGQRSCGEVYLGHLVVGSLYTNAILWTGWPEMMTTCPRTASLEVDIRWILDQIPLVADMDVELVYE